MADSKITALTALTGANVDTADVLGLVDLSDTTMDASGTNKKITATELAIALQALGGVYASLPPHTLHPAYWYNTCQVGQATRYIRVQGSGSISKIAVHIVGSSGNISVAVYRNTGTGVSAAPGTRLATSGSVACPAAGYAEVSLGATVAVNAGDWFGISADNATVSVKGNGTNNGVNSNAARGYLHSEGSVHPCPTTPSLSPTYIIGIPMGLIGVA